MLLFVILLLAHEWCPPACCGDGNCRPIPCEDIVYKKGGETGYTTACYDGFTFYQWNWMESKDSGCHACYQHVNTNIKLGRCLFLPKVTS